MTVYHRVNKRKGVRVTFSIESPDFGLAVEHRLLDLKMTKRDFAKHAGIDVSYLWYIMNNRRKAIKTREKIIEVLNKLEKDSA